MKVSQGIRRFGLAAAGVALMMGAAAGAEAQVSSSTTAAR